LLGAVLIGWYVRVTPYNSRTHDIGSHLAYIQRTEDRGGIPRDTDCWECHQPFGYYVRLSTTYQCESPDGWRQSSA
jgi:hypothetical protein